MSLIDNLEQILHNYSDSIVGLEQVNVPVKEIQMFTFAFFDAVLIYKSYP